MTKIGRNKPCPCGSGKKYKKCCLDKLTPDVSDVSDVFFDNDEKKAFIFKENMLVNQLQRDSRKIEQSFDNLCKEEIEELSRLQSDIAGILFAGIAKTTKKEDELRFNCGQLLMNATNSFTAAVHVLRSGYLLQPPVLMRNILENLAVVIHLIINPNDLKIFKEGKFPSSKTISSAKKAIPPFGQFYGQLSKHFAHIGSLYYLINPPLEYEELNDPLRLNLTFLRLILWLLYVSTELTFYDIVPEPRYWKSLGNGVFCYAPNDDEKKWQQSFLAKLMDIEISDNA